MKLLIRVSYRSFQDINDILGKHLRKKLHFLWELFQGSENFTLGVKKAISILTKNPKWAAERCPGGGGSCPTCSAHPGTEPSHGWCFWEEGWAALPLNKHLPKPSFNGHSHTGVTQDFNKTCLNPVLMEMPRLELFRSPDFLPAPSLIPIIFGKATLQQRPLTDQSPKGTLGFILDYSLLPWFDCITWFSLF